MRRRGGSSIKMGAILLVLDFVSHSQMATAMVPVSRFGRTGKRYLVIRFSPYSATNLEWGHTPMFQFTLAIPRILRITQCNERPNA